MIPRLMGLAILGAMIAGFSSGARSGTLNPRSTTGDSSRASAAAITQIGFTITVPAESPTRSASFSVAGADGTPTASGARVDCTATCAGSISVPFGSQKFTAKLFDGKNGTGRLVAMGSTRQLITTQTRSIPLTFNTVVASVKLALEHANIFADAGATTHLLVYALDAHGAVIVGPGYYLNSAHKRITIDISNSAPSNTTLAPDSFQQPMPSAGASNVATVKYKGRAHFDFPNFTVATPGLPSVPAGGVTLTYVPDPENGLAIDDNAPLQSCIGDTNASVGGYYYGGPFFGVNGPLSGATTTCTIPAPFTPDILQVTASGTYVTYQVNPNGDTTGIRLGFGADKGIYFAYTSQAVSGQTIFGYILHPAVITSATTSTAKVSSTPRIVRANAGRLITASAKITSVSGLTLGNDGSLWFTGVFNGKQAIGKLPPAGTPKWGPRVYTVPNADTLLSLEPGIGKTEAFLYTFNNKFYIATVNTDLSGFKTFPVLTGASPSSVTPGDLLAGPLGSFYISAAYTNNSLTSNNVYKIASTGSISTICTNVNTVYRLSDGTGIGFRDFPGSGNSAVIHVVPGQGCTQVPDPPEPLAPAGFTVFSGLYGVDSTAADWLFFSNPHGHRGGIF